MTCGSLVGQLHMVAENVMPQRWTAAHTPRPPKKPELADEFLGSAARIPRFIAWILDGLIVGVPISLIMAVFGLEVITLEDPEWVGGPQAIHVDIPLLVLLWIPQAAYYIVFPTTYWMATPGKRMLSLRVTDASGDRIGLVQSGWRYACQTFILCVFIPFAILVVPGGLIVVPIALFIVLAANHEQSPWDMLAGTRVLE
jgi:uncharacterized RDD family membrane protein YckC